MSLLIVLLKQKDYIGARTLLNANPGSVSVHIEEFLADKEDPTIFYALEDLETLEHLLLISPQSSWAQNYHGDRPLHAACQLPHVDEEVIKLLLFAFPEGASAKNKAGKLALHFAAANVRSLDTIILVYSAFKNAVLEKEGKNNSKPLHYACAFQAPLPIVQFFAEMHPHALEERNKQGDLPLHLSLMYDAPVEVRLFLLSKYARSVQERDSKGRLPLHIAAQSQSITGIVIEALLSAYPESINEVVVDNCDQSDNNWRAGKKAIHIAMRFLHGRADIIRCLLENGSYKEDLKKDDRKSISNVVRMAAYQKNCRDSKDESSTDHESEIQKLNATAEIYLNGDTLLHTALEFNASTEVLGVIVDLRPASLKEINFDGKLPIHFAAWRQVPAETMVFLIRSYPESLLLVDEKTGNCALHYALQYAVAVNGLVDARMIEKVLSYNASASFIVNKAGFYPIHLAARAACPYHIIESLLNVVPFSFGLYSQNRLRLLPIDFAIASSAHADVIGLLLGYSEKSNIITPKRIAEDRERPDTHAKQQKHDEKGVQDTHVLNRPDQNMSEDFISSHEDMFTLMDAHIDLQEKYTAQGEEMRKLRARLHTVTTDLQAKNSEIQGYQKDISWGKDRIRLLQREVDALQKDLDSYK